MATAPPSHSPPGCPSPSAGLQAPRQLKSSTVTTSPSASASPSSPKCLRETGRGAVRGGCLPTPTTPPRTPHSPSGQSSCFRAKCTSERHTWGRGGVRGGTGWCVPPHGAGANAGVTLPARSCPGRAPATAAPAPLRQSPLAAKHKGRVSVGQSPPCPPPQARDIHLCDGVEGGLGLALPATALAEGCAEGCRDTGGEVQVQLQPPDAH